jgi:thiol-disulfide isomerase/thioredoxin
MPMRLGTEMPSLDGATEWLNGDFELEKAKATLVHFWAVSCHICHETMPDVQKIRNEYRFKGLQTIAVHMPRMQEDTDIERIKEDLAKYDMGQLCAVDNQHAIANSFQNEFTPAFFVFGPDGKLVFRAAGDKGFQKVEPKVREALHLG